MTLQTINVGELIDKSRLSIFQVRIFLICLTVSLVDGFDTLTTSYALSSIAAEWHLKPQDFSSALTVGLIGLMVGGVVLGQLADRFGRRPMVLFSILLFGGFTLFTAHAQNVTQLFWLRLGAGLGIGGILPVMTTLVADCAPESKRRTAVMMVIGSMAAGGFLGGLVAKQIIPQFGWRMIFEIGGFASFFMIAVCFFFLPESPLFLAARNSDDPRIATFLKRIAPSLDLTGARFVAHLNQEQRASVGRLFASGRARVTILFWIAMVSQLLLVYTFTLWLPTLLRGAGNTLEVSLLASSLWSLGGLLGSITLGPASEKMGPYATLIFSYLMVCLMSVILATGGTNSVLLYCASLLVGVFGFGSWTALSALVAKYYPPEIRATGGGYAQGLGRIGSVLSPPMVGLFLSQGWSAPEVLLIPIGPAVVAACCVIGVKLLRQSTGEAPDITTDLVEIAPSEA